MNTKQTTLSCNAAIRAKLERLQRFADDLPIVLPLPVQTGKRCVSSTVFHAAEGACRPCRPTKASSKQ